MTQPDIRQIEIYPRAKYLGIATLSLVATQFDGFWWKSGANLVVVVCFSIVFYHHFLSYFRCSQYESLKKRQKIASMICVLICSAVYLSLIHRILIDSYKETFNPKLNVQFVGFKDTPQLTSKRRRRIERSIDEFYRYLSDLGMKHIPNDVPVIRLEPGHSAGFYANFPVETYKGYLAIGTDLVDDAGWIQLTYAGYLFPTILAKHDFDLQNKLTESQNRWDASLILSRYFIREFTHSNRYQTRSDPFVEDWICVLKDIEKVAGREFTIKALSSMPTVINDARPMQDQFEGGKLVRHFHKYFQGKLIDAMKIEGSDKNIDKALSVLNKYDLSG